MGNSNSCKIQEICIITFKLHNEKKRLLTNVRFVPRLKRNLISLSILDEFSFWYKTASRGSHVCNNKNLILYGTKRNGLYVLDSSFHVSTKTDAAIVINIDNDILWYLRIGHLGQKGMHALCKQDFLGKGIVTSLEFCETCVLSRQDMLSFSTGTHLAKPCLENIYVDLWGPA